MATHVGRYKITNITAANVFMDRVPGDAVSDYGGPVTQIRITLAGGVALLLTEFQLNREYNVTVERMS